MVTALIHMIPILPNYQLRQLGRLFDRQPLLVGQMQHADEGETGRDVVHDGFGVDLFEVVDDVCEFEGWAFFVLATVL